MKPNTHGSFIVSKTAILILLHNAATALQIATYLVLSRFRHHKYDEYTSNAGIDSIVNRLRIGRKKAQEQLTALLDMAYNGQKLLSEHDRKTSIAIIDEALSSEPDDLEVTYIMIANASKYPPKKTERIQTLTEHTKRWTLNYGEHNIWIDDRLVGKGRDQIRPLYDLWRTGGDTCARLLLYMMYHSEDITGFVHSGLLRRSYFIDCIDTVNDIDIWKCTEYQDMTFNSKYIIKHVYMISDSDYDQYSELSICKKLREDLTNLERYGLVERFIIVNMLDADNSTRKYILDIKGRSKYKTDDRIFCSEISDIVSDKGFELNRKDKRHYSEYYAIASDYEFINVSMVYRLKHRVTNPKNNKVQQVKLKQAQHDNDVRRWLKVLAGT